jgi:hypothetical protein
MDPFDEIAHLSGLEPDDDQSRVLNLERMRWSGISMCTWRAENVIDAAVPDTADIPAGR